MSEKWLKGEIEAGAVSEEAYIEIVGIICTVLMIDRFAEALGQPEFPLLEPVPGEPSGYRAPGAKMHDAWISLVEPEDVTPEDGNLYDGESWAASALRMRSNFNGFLLDGLACWPLRSRYTRRRTKQHADHRVHAVSQYQLPARSRARRRKL